MKRFEQIAFAVGLLVLADPALAGNVVQTPAPIAGVGLGAIALVGLGYRALKSRINR
jgi:hypothetical protein